ncbi:transcriptional regulator LeuO [Vibrio barjaei]|uniref:transcriptional regulator LeuO n=1 Tax=Vibrio barjaei TaxID=1676683 RepID=UPI002283A132|nr:transcriptional regulator LeuO [Vibrio barjaei]MCY9870361.1 transcriptional regulator LeuO [Vibrio barjaei]
MEMQQNSISVNANNNKLMSSLRAQDLNLLPVFDTVMQEQNITRAAKELGMSQPAVSNAVSRLKVMFDDELFIRHGRGILPTSKARELFGPIRQALQLVKNELPDTKFSPMTTQRQFKVSIASPLDMRLSTAIINSIGKAAPNADLVIESCNDNVVDERLRLQDVDFSLDFSTYPKHGYDSTELYEDDLVVLCSGNHPRIKESISVEQLVNEKHAKLISVQNNQQFSDEFYNKIDAKIALKVQNVLSLLKAIEDTDLVAVLPSSVLTTAINLTKISVLKNPTDIARVKCYLNWHKSSEKDKANNWLKNHLIDTINATRF